MRHLRISFCRIGFREPSTRGSDCVVCGVWAPERSQPTVPKHEN